MKRVAMMFYHVYHCWSGNVVVLNECYIQSLIFSKDFILNRIMVDPEPIPEDGNTLCMGSPVQPWAPCTDTFTPTGNLESSIHLPAYFSAKGGKRKTRMKPTWTQDMWNYTHEAEIRIELRSCEVTKLHTVHINAYLTEFNKCPYAFIIRAESQPVCPLFFRTEIPACSNYRYQIYRYQLESTCSRYPGTIPLPISCTYIPDPYSQCSIKYNDFFIDFSKMSQMTNPRLSHRILTQVATVATLTDLNIPTTMTCTPSPYTFCSFFYLKKA